MIILKTNNFDHIKTKLLNCFLYLALSRVDFSCDGQLPVVLFGCGCSATYLNFYSIHRQMFSLFSCSTKWRLFQAMMKVITSWRKKYGGGHLTAAKISVVEIGQDGIILFFCRQFRPVQLTLHQFGKVLVGLRFIFNSPHCGGFFFLHTSCFADYESWGNVSFIT